jgi:hypothetical protein
MKRDARYVVKSLTCPECKGENRIRFRSSQMMIEGICEHCHAQVRWRRAPHRGVVVTIFDE